MECKLCSVIKNEEICNIDEDFAVAKVADKKGHNFRVMILSKRHIPHKLNIRGIQEAIKFGMTSTNKPFVVLLGDNASITEHWHAIICDMKTDGETADIFKEKRIEVYH